MKQGSDGRADKETPKIGMGEGDAVPASTAVDLKPRVAMASRRGQVCRGTYIAHPFRSNLYLTRDGIWVKSAKSDDCWWDDPSDARDFLVKYSKRSDRGGAYGEVPMIMLDEIPVSVMIPRESPRHVAGILVQRISSGEFAEQLTAAVRTILVGNVLEGTGVVIRISGGRRREQEGGG